MINTLNLIVALSLITAPGLYVSLKFRDLDLVIAFVRPQFFPRIYVYLINISFNLMDFAL